MFIDNSNGRGPKSGDKRRRLYGKELVKELQNNDFELEIFKNLKWCYCDLNNVLLDGLRSTDVDMSRICSEIDQHISFLKKN